jgi:hypothetical protein
MVVLIQSSSLSVIPAKAGIHLQICLLVKLKKQMPNSQKVYPAKPQRSRGFVIPLIIAIVAVLAIGTTVYLTDHKKVEAPVVVKNCVSQPDGTPVITSLSTTSGLIGTVLQIHGCNLSGFEGDLNVYFERADGEKALLTDTFGSYSITNDKLIKVTVKEPCKSGEIVYGPYSGLPSQCPYVEMIPGIYKVYATPWGKKSNVVNFTITPKAGVVTPVIKTGSSARIGETVILDGVKITPLDVTEDSRCPEGVTCIWAGTVKIKTRIERNGLVEEKELTLLVAEKPLKAGNVNVLLKAVKPTKAVSVPITPDDYIFTFSLVGSAY